MTKNSTISTIKAKWMVRALCRPPNSSGRKGSAAFMPGDIASPVAIIRGKRTKSTAK